MLKRTRDTVRAVAESTGLLAPSIADAQAAAEEHRRTLVTAQTAREAAEQALQAGHDGTADDAAIARLEAALASAKMAEQRAERAYIGAEKRLTAAGNAEAETLKAAAIAKRDSALATFTKAAAAIDRLAADMAVHIQSINNQYSAFNESRRDNVAGLFTPIDGATLADFALKRAIAERNGVWTGDKPTAAELAGQVSGAALAVA